MPENLSVIHQAEQELRERWKERFARLSPDSLQALADALMDLRRDALTRAELQWRRHKGPMALYWKVIGVYAGHLARVLLRLKA